MFYDKEAIRESLEIEQIFKLVESLGGEPQITSFGLTSRTICHNPRGNGSRKLYYYNNSKLFHCYTGCDQSTFDVFGLVTRVLQIQQHIELTLYNSICYVVNFFGLDSIGGDEPVEEQILDDWSIFDKYSKISTKTKPLESIVLPEYNPVLLTKFEYPRILTWEQEGILRHVCKKNLIGYYPGEEQITIPHFDDHGRLIGIRGRALVDEEADRFGKYRPLWFDNQWLTHPLGMNLYNLNNSKKNIEKTKVAIIFEGEKSTLRYQSLYGIDHDISVACCGSSISTYQVELLKKYNAQEIIIAFDKQFQEKGSQEFKAWTRKLTTLNNKFCNDIKVSVIFDKQDLLGYKESPIDRGKKCFESLLATRLYL